MVDRVPTVTAAGARAPDFVPMWVQLLIVVVAFGVLAVSVRRRNKR
ncbi:hypothetical protein [Streptomyces rishiriensis]|uniref:IPTL-CTERM sorting domain-containing protein n=1 Tax=Streptomyces rishiriensis TaxID=68264 RepID=A0ABU0P3Q6_STRRH|nr:hypothetical protein [Streptomyces rishiriensis]MDQ0585372.1 hypothetical protein [Streptomyces rishiriensis]